MRMYLPVDGIKLKVQRHYYFTITEDEKLAAEKHIGGELDVFSPLGTAYKIDGKEFLCKWSVSGAAPDFKYNIVLKFECLDGEQDKVLKRAVRDMRKAIKGE